VARKEAKADQEKAAIRGNKSRSPVVADLPQPSGGNSDAGRWADRAVKMAGGPAAGVSPRSVRAMEEVAKAPETVAKVDAGEISTVSRAVEAAAEERGKPAPPRLWQESLRTELSRARGHLNDGLAALDGPAVLAKVDELAGLLDELDRLLGEIRARLANRGVLP
jgi:hypothetical protein